MSWLDDLLFKAPPTVQTFTTPGTLTLTAPATVRFVMCGGGGGGGGSASGVAATSLLPLSGGGGAGALECDITVQCVAGSYALNPGAGGAAGTAGSAGADGATSTVLYGATVIGQALGGGGGQGGIAQVDPSGGTEAIPAGGVPYPGATNVAIIPDFTNVPNIIQPQCGGNAALYAALPGGGSATYAGGTSGTQGADHSGRRGGLGGGAGGAGPYGVGGNGGNGGNANAAGAGAAGSTPTAPVAGTGAGGGGAGAGGCGSTSGGLGAAAASGASGRIVVTVFS